MDLRACLLELSLESIELERPTLKMGSTIHGLGPGLDKQEESKLRASSLDPDVHSLSVILTLNVKF